MSLEQKKETNREKEPGKGSRKKLLLSLVFVSVVVVLLFAVGVSRGFSDSGDKAGIPTAAEKEEKGPVALSVLCVGDVMVHRPQIASQYQSETGTYDYTDNFRYISPYIQEADLALCNVETTFAGGTPTGYPSFNAPDALADALYQAGFDVAMTSNNHMFDKGLAGLQRTLKVLRESGLETTGTQLTGEENYAIKKVKGIPVGIVSYTYETPSAYGRPTINSNVLSEEEEPYINSFSYEELDPELLRIGNTIKKAREAGAKIVICYYHWGQEYQRSPGDAEIYMAEKSADMGADMVFASHPHVLQGVGTVTGIETGRQIPVFYSMGNCISNQRSETLDNRYTEQGLMARVDLTFDAQTGTVAVQSVKGMGTWVDKYRSGGRDHYAVIPLDENYKENETLAVSGHLSRATQALTDIEETLGAEYIWK